MSLPATAHRQAREQLRSGAATQGVREAPASFDGRTGAVAQRVLMDAIQQSRPLVAQRERIAALQSGTRQRAPAARNSGLPVQGVLNYGPVKPVRSVSELANVRKPGGEPASKKEFFNGNKDRWKQRLGSRWNNMGERNAYMQRAFDTLKELIADPDHTESASTADTLLQAVANYTDAKNRAALALESAKAARALSHDAEEEGEEEERAGEDEISELARPFYSWLRESRRAFPAENLLHVARKATVDAPGFVYELELAVSALQQMPESYVQFGALPLRAIEQYLPQRLAAYTQKVKGAVGGDITVWIPHAGPSAEEEKKHPGPSSSSTPTVSSSLPPFGADFVQAKAIKFTSITDEVRKATNQLAGQCAHARSDVRASDRETTLQGGGFMGSIFVKLMDGVGDLAVMDRVATKALSNEFVHWVVFDDTTDGRKYIYPGGHTL